jgi:hypothetical protein
MARLETKFVFSDCNLDSDLDSDGDGTPDCQDECPDDPLKTAAGVCGCGFPDDDFDGDTVPYCIDLCTGEDDLLDSDADGVADCLDDCPDDPDKFSAGTCGCGVADTDTDGDGAYDCEEVCYQDPNKTDPGICGCGVEDLDSDGDGTPDCIDADAVDTDNDGLFDGEDPCATDALNACYGAVATDQTTGDLIRINANVGSPDCSGVKIDCNGDTWLADFGYNQSATASTCDLNGGGESCVIDGIAAVFGCIDAVEDPDPTVGDGDTEDLFQCDHGDAAAAPELIYSFDLPNGSYNVNLLFANTATATTGIGTRVFDIVIEGTTVYTNFDQVDAAGGSGVAVVRAAVVAVGDGNGLQIELRHVTDDPAIKGILVRQQGP